MFLILQVGYPVNRCKPTLPVNRCNVNAIRYTLYWLLNCACYTYHIKLYKLTYLYLFTYLLSILKFIVNLKNVIRRALSLIKRW